MRKSILLCFLAVLLAVLASCSEPEAVVPGPEIPVDPVYVYENQKTVSDVDGLIDALENLSASTVITLEEGVYDFEGAATSVTVNGQTGWMIPVTVDNVMIKAADGADVVIRSTDEIPNGAHASQTIFHVSGENFVLDGITVGTRGSLNKSIELASRNAIIRNCSFIDGACLYVSSKDAVNTTVRNCSFSSESSISFTDGATILNMYGNSFEDGAVIYFTGKRDSGWNENTINLSSVDFISNTFAPGATIVLKATEEDYATCFADFDPEKLFGMKLVSTEGPDAGTYNSLVNTYVK